MRQGRSGAAGSHLRGNDGELAASRAQAQRPEITKGYAKVSEYVRVADKRDLPPGGRTLCEVAGEPVAVINFAGRLYAFANRCPHRGGPVGAGPIEGGVVTCPWHGREFNFTTGYCLSGDTANLQTYRVKIRGHDVLIEVPEQENAGEQVFRYVVRYGSPGFVGRFGSIRHIQCQRGDCVVVLTDRGEEQGEVLVAPGEQAADEHEPRPAGELLRRWTTADEQQLQAHRDDHLAVFERCQASLAERSIAVSVVDAETLLDGRTIVLYYLGAPTAELGPVAVELARDIEARVQFQAL